MIYVLNGAYLLMFVGLAIRNMLVLRMILVSAQSMFIVFGLVTGNYVVLTWNALFFAINLFQIIVLFRQRAPVAIPEAVEDIYEDVFKEMTKREFLYFWQIGRERTYAGEEVIYPLESIAGIIPPRPLRHQPTLIGSDLISRIQSDV